MRGSRKIQKLFCS
jgi:hypothetical protein